MSSISKKVLNSVMVALMSVSCEMGSVSAMIDDTITQNRKLTFVERFTCALKFLSPNLSATWTAWHAPIKDLGTGSLAAGAVLDLAKLGVLAGGLAATVKAIQYKSQLNKLKKNQPVSKTTPEKNKNTEIKINVSPAKPVVAQNAVTNQITK